eukprot:1178172-Prorocentrum_minimum.AAC.6
MTEEADVSFRMKPNSPCAPAPGGEDLSLGFLWPDPGRVKSIEELLRRYDMTGTNTRKLFAACVTRVYRVSVTVRWICAACPVGAQAERRGWFNSNVSMSWRRAENSIPPNPPYGPSFAMPRGHSTAPATSYLGFLPPNQVIRYDICLGCVVSTL